KAGRRMARPHGGAVRAGHPARPRAAAAADAGPSAQGLRADAATAGAAAATHRGLRRERQDRFRRDRSDQGCRPACPRRHLDRRHRRCPRECIHLANIDDVPRAQARVGRDGGCYHRRAARRHGTGPSIGRAAPARASENCVAWATRDPPIMRQATGLRSAPLATDTRSSPAARLRPLPLANVRVDSGFWADRRAVIRDASLEHGFRMLGEWGNLDNLRIASGSETTKRYRGPVFQDSDVYKWLEAVAYYLPGGIDAELQRMADDAISLIERAQATDGYLNSYWQVV